MGTRDEISTEKQQADFLVNIGFSCFSQSSNIVCFTKMQLYGIYRLTIHPFFFKWCSHYYLCTNLSYTSHLQLYTVYLSSTESREFLHLKSLLIYCFLTCSSFYSFFILDISFLFNPANLQWQCVFQEAIQPSGKAFFFIFFFWLCLSFALFRFLSTSTVTAAIILSILVWLESCTIQCGLQSRLQATTNL